MYAIGCVKESASLSVHVVNRLWERVRHYQLTSEACGKESASLSAHVSRLWQRECVTISWRRQQVVAKRVRHYQFTSSAGCGKESASLSVHVVSRLWERVRQYQLMSVDCGKESASPSAHVSRLWQRECVTISSRRQQVVAKRVRHCQQVVGHHQILLHCDENAAM